jgi:hypothetical protein
VVLLKEKDIGDYVLTRVNYSVQPHYPGMGRGLAQSLFVLVRGASHYIWVCRTPKSELSQVVGNSVADPPIGYPFRRHLGSPAVALELHLKKGR